MLLVKTRACFMSKINKRIIYFLNISFIVLLRFFVVTFYQGLKSSRRKNRLSLNLNSENIYYGASSRWPCWFFQTIGNFYIRNEMYFPKKRNFKVHQYGRRDVTKKSDPGDGVGLSQKSSR